MYKYYSTVGMAGDELKHQISGYTNTRHSLIKCFSKQTLYGSKATLRVEQNRVMLSEQPYGVCVSVVCVCVCVCLRVSDSGLKNVCCVYQGVTVCLPEANWDRALPGSWLNMHWDMCMYVSMCHVPHCIIRRESGLVGCFSRGSALIHRQAKLLSAVVIIVVCVCVCVCVRAHVCVHENMRASVYNWY